MKDDNDFTDNYYQSRLDLDLYKLHLSLYYDRHEGQYFITHTNWVVELP